MKSRIWFLLSILLFIAAVFFWRLGDDRNAARRAAREQASAASTENVGTNGSNGTVSARKPLADLQTNSAATNPPSLYPYRLTNTSQTVEQMVRSDRAILLVNALIDTSAGEVSIPEHLRTKGDPGSYIVQACGPTTELFRADLREAKAEIISYVPNNAFLVRMPVSGVKILAAKKGVCSILPYQPYYKLDTDLIEMAVKNEAQTLDRFVRLTLFPGQRETVLEALKGKATVVSDDPKGSPFGPTLVVSSGNLVALANLAPVQAIETYHSRVLLNDLTRVRLGVATDTLTSTPNFQGLTGSNIFVNVNDTTIDNGHPDLTGRIFPLAGVATTDTDGHGTHVTGIIGSSGPPDEPNGANVPGSVASAGYRGKGAGIKILSMDIFAGFSDTELQEIAASTNYVTLNRQSSLISNNSWGYGSSSYDSAAAKYDMAVRDAIPGMTGSQPMIYVFAAGNSGGGNNNGQGGTPPLSSPATAKNVISVGALENFRNITNDIIRPNSSCVVGTNKEFLGLTDSSNEVAFFSSRGNVGVSLEGTFGRFKPDLVAPGTFVASTRSRQFDEGAYYSTTNYDVQTFPNVVINPGATNQFLIFIPDDPCAQGRAISFSIETEANASSPLPFPPLNIYVGTAPASVAFAGANFVQINEGAPFFSRGLVYYDIVNTNSVEVSYNLKTVVTVTNNFGNYFTELKKLNDGLGTNYIFESGTSMAAPAVSGMLALMQEFFEQTLPVGLRRTNSPAMMKALLINSSRAAGPGYNLKVNRSLNIQGWGLPNLTRTIPEILASEPDTNKWPIQMFEQSTTEALATGEVHTRNVAVANTNSPLRITLVWTDPPGNPTVGVKLVNDLDLVVKAVVTGDNGTGTNTTVTNIYVGNNFPGGNEFTDAIEAGTNLSAEVELVRDVVNNVENVYINGPLAATYEVSVMARRVNVNAVTGHTNGIVQDYALVISSGDLTETAPIQVTPASPPTAPNPNPFVTIISNAVPLFNQRVGANSPLLATNAGVLSNGAVNQWNFYVLNNPSNFQNVAFLTFLPPNLSGTLDVSPNSRRNVEADIDMYVSTDSGLTNLDATVIAASTKSRKRGGQELVVFTNAAAPVYYVGIKSEDQQAAEYSFFGVVSLTPFSQSDGNGNLILNAVPVGGVAIPDGSPDKPGGVPFISFATTPITVGRVIVTNTFTHERFGDLIGILTHEQDFAVLHNHSMPESAAFPEGQESGTFTGIYDDSNLNDIVGSRPSDGPGSLLSFVGKEGVGAWIYTIEDNAINATGRVDALSIFLERALETNQLNNGFGFSISPVSIPAGQSRGLSFVVPPNATNMIISISPKEGPIDTVVRRGLNFPTRTAPGGPYVDKGKLISPPGDSLTVNTSDIPPLTPGRYSLRLFNDGGSAVTVRGFVRFELNLTAASLQTYVSRGPTPALDDAVTNSIIHVNRDSRVAGVEVGVHIDHPRVSDLVLHLVSPSGTRVLLAENRGGITTNGYGYSAFTTNTSFATGGTELANTNTIVTGLNSGIVNINYNFLMVPDNLRVYYDTLLIFDSGLVSGSGRFSIPFGPGIDTNIVIVVNGDGNRPMSFWNYEVQIVSGALIYATFSENINLALVPIKFAIPPFATNPPGSRVTFDSSSFESDLPGTYTNFVDGWTVTTNSVDVSNAAVAHTGTNYLDLGIGAISRTLPTTQSKLYNLSFAYRSGASNSFSAANVALDGVFTNEFIGVPAWIVHSTTFAAPASGTKFDFTGLDPGMRFDSFELTEGGDRNYFLPEESLNTFIGENAKGDWKLEVWDSRAGAFIGGQVLSWQLQLTFASTNAVATTITNGVTVTNTVAGAEIIYFIIDVPISATRATNVLVSGGGPLNLLFNGSQLPIGNAALGDLTLLSSTFNGTNVLTTDAFPYLQPGGRYYLGVKNVSAAQTNVFTLTVTFDETNNLFNVTPLQNMVTYGPTNLPLNRTIQYYQYDLTNAVSSIEFKLFNMSGDVDLVVRRNALPTQSNYDYTSSRGGTNDEVLTVNAPAAGRYYLGVYGFFPTNNITYSILVTEGAAVNTTPTFIGSGTLTTNGFQISANTIIGRSYDFQFSTDLITWTSVPGYPVTAVSAITVFTDPTATSTQPARFYRLVLLGTVATTPPTFIGSGTLTGSGFQISANTIVGRSYRFQYSTDFIAWTTVPPDPVVATSTTTIFTDPTASQAQTARFYRLILLP